MKSSQRPNRPAANRPAANRLSPGEPDRVATEPSIDEMGIAMTTTRSPSEQHARSQSRRSPLDQVIVTCEHCDGRIRNIDQLQLLRSCDTAPESSTAVTVHADCTEAFLDTHPGAWQRYEGRSSSASWFLPMMIRWPDTPSRTS
jgi:hypothetical protein